MEGYFYKPTCKCQGKKTKKCSCGAKWSFTIDIGIDPKTGKRKQKKKGGFKTKTEAQEACANMIYELQNKIYINESRITFEEFAEEFLSMYSSTGIVKESTVRVRKHEIARLSDYLAKLKLRDITHKRYQNALNDLKKREFAENTISGVHGTARMIFKKAMEMELIKKDPTEFANVPKTVKTIEEIEKEKEVPKYMEKEELSLFLKTAKEKGLDIDYTLFFTLAYTGMRLGELCALKWKDIDLEEGTISISKTLYNPTNNIKGYKLQLPKTKTSKRVIDIDEVVIEEIEKLRLMQNKMKMKKRNIYHDEDFVFVNCNRYPGYPLTLKMVGIRMKRLCRLSKLSESLTPHSLRHTHTSLLAEAGVNLETIMERLGHKNDEVTRNVYLHVTKSQKKEASQKFSELMKSL